MKLRLVRLLVLAAAVLAFATPSSAQVFTGRIDVTVSDSTGAVLPGVTVELTGPQNRTGVTDASGEARFLNLAPGTYAVAAKLQGFADYMNNSVAVTTGGTVPLRVTLAVAGLASAVEVTAETPVIDPKRMTTSTNVTNQQLQEIPSSRDPWVVLQTVPGVIVDRVNVGGAESGQQSSFQAKGSSSGENTWNIDGIAITDMSATGSSATYYDFDMFEEMQVTTGGADLQSATGGVNLNMVLKSGSNTPRGSGRVYYENESMQATNLPEDLIEALGGSTGNGNRIDEYTDYGGELGGPVWRDRIWAWGAYGKTDVTVLTLNGAPDQTILDNRSFKATGQATQNIRGSYTYFRGDKLKYGRNAGPKNPPETTYNQSGPSPLHKGEVNLVLSDNIFLTARGATVAGGFQLEPQGGYDVKWYVDDDGVNHGSANGSYNDRPQKAVSGDGSYFRGRHEIKFGAGWRAVEGNVRGEIPGWDGVNGIVSVHDGYPNMLGDVWVPSASGTEATYLHGFLGDTITFDRLTVNIGVRWDRQSAGVSAGTQQGFSLFPDILPDITATAREDVLVFNSITPRIGVTYALDASRRTLARASYAAFADQMGAGAAGFMSTVGTRGFYLYDITDLNGNMVIDEEEIAGRTCPPATPSVCRPYGTLNLDNPGEVRDPIHTVGDYKTPITHEFQLGLDRELVPNFGVSGTFTYRQFTNFNWRNNGVIGTDYVESFRFAGNHPAVGDYDVPVYIATRRPAVAAATEYRSRPGYSQRYLGFEAAATKRLSNRWMARFGFSTNRHTEHFDSLEAMTDPTGHPAGPNLDGGLVVRQTGGSGKSNIYQVLPSYQFIATGMYQAPWGINLAGNMVTRQGFAAQYYRDRVPTPGDRLAGSKTVFVLNEAAAVRLPTVTSLDLRLGKQFTFQRIRANIDLDLFNALNSATVLGRDYNLRSSTAGDVQEIMNPRILRLGLRVNF